MGGKKVTLSQSVPGIVREASDCALVCRVGARSLVSGPCSTTDHTSREGRRKALSTNPPTLGPAAIQVTAGSGDGRQRH